MTESEAIRARHAVRNYTTKPLSPAVIDGLKEEIDQCNRLGQLHIQLVTENGEAFKSRGYQSIERGSFRIFYFGGIAYIQRQQVG